MIDLVVLVPDKKLDFTMRGILARHHSLGISPIVVEIHTHPEHDHGCYGNAPEFLQFAIMQARYALVVFDHHGSGQDHRMDRIEMEEDLENRLVMAGWRGRSAAIVIAPELESWVWSDSPHVDTILGWSNRMPPLRDWLVRRRIIDRSDTKPPHPKEAMLAALREVRKSQTSKIFSDLATRVSFDRCTDDAFLKLKRVLKEWFFISP